MTQTNEQLAEAIAKLLKGRAFIYNAKNGVEVEGGRNGGYWLGIQHHCEALAHRCLVALCEEYRYSVTQVVDEDSLVYVGYDADCGHLNPDEFLNFCIILGEGKTHQEAIFNAVLNHSKGVA